MRIDRRRSSPVDGRRAQFDPLYVVAIWQLLDEGVDGSAHQPTACELLRVDAQPVSASCRHDSRRRWRLIASARIPAAEMYQTFNMGVGFCVVVAASRSIARCRCSRCSEQARVIGRAVRDPSRALDRVDRPGRSFAAREPLLQLAPRRG
jgi:phosphoribosylaminoimidazole (AIR) synthetase